MNPGRKPALRMTVPVLACVAALGCAPVESEGPTGLVVATSTDLQIPKDITHLGLVITHEGRQKFASWYKIGADGVRLPATLAIEPGLNDDPVTIQLFARRGPEVLSLREAVVPVPRDRLAMLPINIDWLSLGMVENLPPEASGGKDDSGDPSLPGFEPSFELTVSTCPEGETPVAGTCTSSQLSPGALPSYQEGLVFGGGDAHGNEGTCFDTVTCFADSVAVIIPDRANCIGYVSPGNPFVADRLSIGLIPLDGAGICGATGCVVPLDRVSPGAFEPGWVYSPTADNTLFLPPAVCRKLDEGVIRAVVAGTSCESKTPSIPTCGPWSVVAGDAPEPDDPDLLAECQELVERACDGIRRCRGNRGWLRGMVDEEGSCSERLAYLCDPSLMTATAETWRDFFDACQEAWETEDCTKQQKAVRSACREPSASNDRAVETGEPCNFGECGKGDFCLGAIPNGCGVCQPRYEDDAGVHCGSEPALDTIMPGGSCADGLGCRSEELRCAPYGDRGDDCQRSNQCAVGLVCVDGSCRPAAAEGDSCESDEACALGLHCIASGNSGKCRGPRAEDKSCAVVGPDEDLWDENLCDLSAGLRCDPTTMTCRPVESATTGDECSPLSQCRGGLCSGLDGETNESWTCQPFLSDGEPCMIGGVPCEPPAQCIAGVCRLRPVFGQCGPTMVDLPGTLPTCPDGQVGCNGACRNLMTDPMNCGACGLACPSEQCVDGVCLCPIGLVRCGADCVDTLSDTEHCGACFNACPDGATCTGDCLCPTGELDCDGVCTDILFDADHCGACDNECANGCFNGECITEGAGGAGGGGAPATGGVGGAGGVSEGGAGGEGGIGVSGTPPNGGEAGSDASSGGAPTGGMGGTGGVSPWSECVAGMTSSFVVNGYGTAGDWNGYVYTAADATSEVLPDCLGGDNACYADQGPYFCAAGTVDASFDAYIEVGFNFNQSVSGDMPEAWILDGSGLNVSLGCATAKGGLRVEVNGEVAGTDPNYIYCAPLRQNGYIAWSEFTTYCWAEEGTAEYDLRTPLAAAMPLYSVNIIAPGNGTPRAVAFCVESIEPVLSAADL